MRTIITTDLIKVGVSYKASFNYRGFEAFTAVMFQVEVFWVVTQCSVVKQERFRGACCLHLQGRKVPIPSQHYAASQPRRPLLDL